MTVLNSLMSQVVRHYNQRRIQNQEYWNKGAVGGANQEESPLKSLLNRILMSRGRYCFCTAINYLILQSCETASIESEQIARQGELSTAQTPDSAVFHGSTHFPLTSISRHHIYGLPGPRSVCLPRSYGAVISLVFIPFLQLQCVNIRPFNLYIPLNSLIHIS